MITAKQIRAARALLSWSQQDLADATELSKPTIVDAEKEGHQARAETMGKITEALESHGLEFMSGGVRERRDITTIYEGDDCYLRLMDDAYRILAPSKGEIMFYAADEKRSPEHIIDKFRYMRKAGVTMRSLVKYEDTHLMGDLDEYKWMSDDLWFDADVKVLFGDRVAYLVTWQNVTRVIVVRDKMISNIEKKFFDFIWKISASPTHSTSKEKF